MRSHGLLSYRASLASRPVAAHGRSLAVRAAPLSRGITGAHPLQARRQFATRTDVSSRWGAITTGAVIVVPLGYLAFTSFQVHGEEQRKKEKHANNGSEAAKSPTIEYKYVLVGGGTASYSALKEIKKNDPKAKVLVITDENHKPYMRPPLSKELWNPDGSPETLTFKAWNGETMKIYYKDTPHDNVTFVLSSVVDMDVANKTIKLDDSRKIKYEKCLLATGGRPRQLPVDKSAASSVSTYRTIDDFVKLEALAREGKHIAVIGGNFLGSELAAGLAKRGKAYGTKVTQIFPEAGSMALVLPKYLSDHATNKLKAEGIDVRSDRTVTQITKKGDKTIVVASDGSKIETDHVVMCVGIQPNAEFAKRAGLAIDSDNGGIVVDAQLKAASGVYAAGDVSSYVAAPFNERRRTEHHDHAARSGAIAGNNMSSKKQKKTYDYLPMFWSDLPGVSYEAVGIIDASLRTVGLWAKEEEEEEGAQQRQQESVGSNNKENDKKNKKKKKKEKKDKKKRQKQEKQLAENGKGNNTAAAEPELKQEQQQQERFAKGLVYYIDHDDRVVGVVAWNNPNKIAKAREVLQRATKAKTAADLQSFIPF